MPGEFDFIHWIRSQQRPSPLIELGIGDDLAILKWPANDLLLVGIDQALDGVHFDSSIHSPLEVGRKVINRNLSDCAAMACLPAAAVVAVALPRHFVFEQARELYLGLREAADPFDCPIVGGDTASWDGKLALSVTIFARTAGVRPVTRAGARPGDGIFVTGPLGGSILGRHISFTPRVALARQLARIATAMIDLSDGLSRDLPHICQSSGVGAVIEGDLVPIHSDAVRLSQRDGVAPLEHALNDGEDYELLFTAPVDSIAAVRIGRITAEPGIWLQNPDQSRRPLQAGGWEHPLGD